MKRFSSIMIMFIVLVFALSACNFPGQEAEPTVDIVATQVAKLLTEGATEEAPPPTETMSPSPTSTEPLLVNSPTPSQTVTQTLTPTPTENLDDPAQQLGQAAWTQDFDGSTSPWDFSYEQATFQTANGYLTMKALANANWHSWYVSSPKLKNAYLEATMTLSNCSGLDRFGLAFRASADGQQFYYLGITCSGDWGFYRMAPDVNIIEISPYAEADALKEGPGQPHRVGVWMEGDSFSFYIDGEKVGTATDSTLNNEGYTGFLIAFANTPGFTVKVDTIKYWTLP